MRTWSRGETQIPTTHTHTHYCPHLLNEFIFFFLISFQGFGEWCLEAETDSKVISVCGATTWTEAVAFCCLYHRRQVVQQQDNLKRFYRKIIPGWMSDYFGSPSSVGGTVSKPWNNQVRSTPNPVPPSGPLINSSPLAKGLHSLLGITDRGHMLAACGDTWPEANQQRDRDDFCQRYGLSIWGFWN